LPTNSTARVDGVEDIREMFRRGLKRARRSLAGTPEQLAVLKEAGVVDAGAQGFVDLLEGVWRYMRSGKVPEMASLARPAAPPRRPPARPSAPNNTASAPSA
jgi:uncharacterized protein